MIAYIEKESKKASEQKYRTPKDLSVKKILKILDAATDPQIDVILAYVSTVCNL